MKSFQNRAVSKPNLGCKEFPFENCHHTTNNPPHTLKRPGLIIHCAGFDSVSSGLSANSDLNIFERYVDIDAAIPRKLSFGLVLCEWQFIILKNLSDLSVSGLRLLRSVTWTIASFIPGSQCRVPHCSWSCVKSEVSAVSFTCEGFLAFRRKMACNSFLQRPNVGDEECKKKKEFIERNQMEFHVPHERDATRQKAQICFQERWILSLSPGAKLAKASLSASSARSALPSLARPRPPRSAS